MIFCYIQPHCYYQLVLHTCTVPCQLYSYTHWPHTLLDTSVTNHRVYSCDTDYQPITAQNFRPRPLHPKLNSSVLTALAASQCQGCKNCISFARLMYCCYTLANAMEFVICFNTICLCGLGLYFLVIL